MIPSAQDSTEKSLPQTPFLGQELPQGLTSGCFKGLSGTEVCVHLCVRC